VLDPVVELTTESGPAGRGIPRVTVEELNGTDAVSRLGRRQRVGLILAAGRV